MSALAFPTTSSSPPRTSYESSPFDDTVGGLWLWDGAKTRWNPVTADPALAVNYLTAMPSGNAVQCASVIDETVYLNTGATAATFTMQMPSAMNCRKGQIKIFMSSYPVTALTVSVPGGSIHGTIPTSADPFIAYTFQCVYKTTLSSIWLRLA